MATSYDAYTGTTDPAGVPGTSSTEQALYNIGPDLAAVVVKMSPMKGKGPSLGVAPSDPKNFIPGQYVLNRPEIPGDQDYQDWSKHDLVTYDRAIGKMGSMPWQDRSQLQQQLWNAGLYKPTQTYVSGELDDTTQAAWTQAVDEAAKEQLSVSEIIDRRTKAITEQGGPDSYYKKQKGAQQPQVTTLTNPLDVKYIADEAAKKRIGRSLTPEELDRFVSVYHGQEQSFSNQKYSAGISGGTAVNAPDPSTSAAAFAEASHPVDAAAQKQVDAFQAVADMFTKQTGTGNTGI